MSFSELKETIEHVVKAANMGDTDPKEYRILRGNGSLGGYRWGLERKRALIDAERKAVS